MTDIAAALDFAHTRRRGVVTTIRRDGRPQLSNILFARAADGSPLISVTDDRAKTRNLRRDPRCALHVTDDSFWRYVVLDGTAEVSAVTETPDDATADRLGDFATAADLGVHLEDREGDGHTEAVAQLGAINERVLDLAAAQSTDIGTRLKEVGVRVLAGTGRLESPARVLVETASGTETHLFPATARELRLSIDPTTVWRVQVDPTRRNLTDPRRLDDVRVYAARASHTPQAKRGAGLSTRLLALFQLLYGLVGP